MKFNKPFRRLLGATLVLTFTGTQALTPLPAFAQIGNPLWTGREATIEDDLGFLHTLPQDLGRVSDFSFNASAPLVIHIQDAHSHPEAQQKIHDLLEALRSETSRRQKTLVVAMEGAMGSIHPEYLDLLPGRPEINRKIIEDLFAKGELSGVELFAWEKRGEEGPRKVRFLGAEEAGLYRENLALYRELLFKREFIDENLERLVRRD